MTDSAAATAGHVNDNTELRQEYNRSDLGVVVRGKYFETSVLGETPKPTLGYKVVWRGPEGFEPAVVSAQIKYRLGEKIEKNFFFGAFTLFDSQRAAKAWRSRRGSSANHAILLCEYERFVPKYRDTTKETLFYRLWTYFKPETGAILTDKYLVRVDRDLPETSLPNGTVFAKSLTPKEVVL